MKEMYDLMDSVNQWVDDGQALINGYKEDLPSDEQENLKKRAQVLHKLCHISCEVLNRITTPHSSLLTRLCGLTSLVSFFFTNTN